MRPRVPHVVYCFDPNYLPCGLVSIYSVLKHASGPVKVTVVGGNFEPRHTASLLELNGHFPESNVEIRHFDLSEFKSVENSFDNTYFTTSILMRLHIPWLVEGRVVYLDADTLVIRDIAELYGSDLSGYPLGACLGVGMAMSYRKRHRFRLSNIFGSVRGNYWSRYFENAGEALGVDFERRYFNSGVLVMDTDAIRSRDVDRELTDLAKAESKWQGFHDQDWLNFYFRSNVQYLDLKYNVFPKSGNNLKYASPEMRLQIKMSIANPSIIHYAGGTRTKPWNRKRYRRRRFDRLYLSICDQMTAETGIPVRDMLRSQNSS